MLWTWIEKKREDQLNHLPWTYSVRKCFKCRFASCTNRDLFSSLFSFVNPINLEEKRIIPIFSFNAIYRLIDRCRCHINGLFLKDFIIICHPKCHGNGRSNFSCELYLPDDIESFDFCDLFSEKIGDCQLKLIEYSMIGCFTITNETNIWFTENAEKSSRSTVEKSQTLS